MIHDIFGSKRLQNSQLFYEYKQANNYNVQLDQSVGDLSEEIMNQRKK